MRKLSKKEKNHKLKKDEKIMRYLQKINNRKLPIPLESEDPNEESRVQKEDPIFSFLEINNFFMKYRFKVKRDRKEEMKSGIVEIPEEFSLITNTDQSLRVFKRIMYISKHESLDGIHIDQKINQKMSLCASTILSVIILSVIKRNEILEKNLMISGELDRIANFEVFEMVSASGLKKVLDKYVNTGDGYTKNVYWEESENLITLDLITPKGNNLITNRKYNSDSDNVSKLVTEYVEKCLKTQGFKLNVFGTKLFQRIIGEIIDNCNLHSDFENSWFCSGYAKTEENHINCKLVIFNLGNTIYESIGFKSVRKQVPDKLEEIFIGMNQWYYTRENIYTHLALQDGISRFFGPDDHEDDRVQLDRGTGMTQLIRKFNEIGKSNAGKKPQMILISGNTKIIFDDKYVIEEKNIHGTKRDIIAFNKENDIYKIPDKNNVIKLKEHFPGTILSLEFCLEENYLEQLDEKEWERIKR